MLDDVIKLISRFYAKDAYGVLKPTSTERVIFARVESITRQEFYEAGRSGLNPAFKFIVFAEDYQDEGVCEYNGKKYAVYRTYRVPDSDYIELYVQREGGVNGGQNN